MTEELATQILGEIQALRGEVRELRATQDRVMPERPMTPKEFGVIIGKSTRTVMRLINRRRLVAKKEGGIILITPANARRFLDPQPKGAL